LRAVRLTCIFIMRECVNALLRECVDAFPQAFVFGLQAAVLGLEVVVLLAPFAVGLVEVVDAAVQFVDAALVGGDALAEVAVLLLELVYQLAPGFNLRIFGLGFRLFDCGGYGENTHQTAAGGQSNQCVNPIYSHFLFANVYVCKTQEWKKYCV